MGKLHIKNISFWGVKIKELENRQPYYIIFGVHIGVHIKVKFSIFLVYYIFWGELKLKSYKNRQILLFGKE